MNLDLSKECGIVFVLCILHEGNANKKNADLGKEKQTKIFETIPNKSDAPN